MRLVEGAFMFLALVFLFSVSLVTRVGPVAVPAPSKGLCVAPLTSGIAEVRCGGRAGHIVPR